jgi:hypothetical protein
VELKAPPLQAIVIKGFLLKQSDQELEEMARTLVMIADRLRPLMAEEQTILRIGG